MHEFSLEDILSNDPLGILVEAKPKAKSINEDDRLIASFEEINSFIETNGHELLGRKEFGQRAHSHLAT